MKTHTLTSISIFLLPLLFLAACKEDVPDPDKAHIGDVDWPYYIAADFGCGGITAKQYFSCTLDGKEFCRNAFSADTSYTRKFQTIITDEPYMVVGGSNTVVGYSYSMGINDKDWILAGNNGFSGDGNQESTVGLEINFFNKRDISWCHFLDNFIQAQEKLSFSKLEPGYGNDTSGFLVKIWLTCKSNLDGSSASLVDFTSGGPQTSNSYLRCTEKIKEDRGSYYAYFLTFEFACNMYSDNKGERLWRKLKNGKMEIEIHLKK